MASAAARLNEPGEHAQPGEQRLLAGGQQAEAPVQGVAQGLLPLGQVPGPAGQQAEPLVKPRRQGLRRQQPDPGRGQLDGQRQPVQPAADLRDRRRVAAGQLEARVRGVRPLGEQAHRGVAPQLFGVRGRAGGRDRQRRHRELVLAGQPQHRPAGHQHHQARSGRQQPGQQRSRPQHLLEIVQRQQQPPGPQVRTPGRRSAARPTCSTRAPRRSRAPPGPPPTPRPARRTARRRRNPGPAAGPPRPSAGSSRPRPDRSRSPAAPLPGRPGPRGRRPPARGPAAAWPAPEAPRPAAPRPRRPDRGRVISNRSLSSTARSFSTSCCSSAGSEKCW